VQGDGFGFELENVYEFGGGGAGEGCGELGVVIRREGVVYWPEKIMCIVIMGGPLLLVNWIAGVR